MTGRELPIPPHVDLSQVDLVRRIPYGEIADAARAWREQHSIPPAAHDPVKVLLMPIDVQNTFCNPAFELFVGGRSGHGAVEDVHRLCEFIYRNLTAITQIAPTMDTHTAIQIFHPIFWVDAAGQHPPPYTLITQGDVLSGRWMVNPDVAPAVAGGDLQWLQRMAEHYVERLSAGGKYALTIWPYHAMLGGIGHALVSALEEAVFFHTVTRFSQTGFQIKGNNPLTENYSVLKPEVLEGPDGQPIAHRNAAFIAELLTFDMVIIAGEAKSHCMAWTIDDLLDEIRQTDGALARKVYLLEDCSSPVVIPGVIDYTEQADEAFRRFANAGMHVVRSTDPIERWPDSPLA
jgi:nicotinamidase-related amidase